MDGKYKPMEPSKTRKAKKQMIFKMGLPPGAATIEQSNVQPPKIALETKRVSCNETSGCLYTEMALKVAIRIK